MSTDIVTDNRTFNSLHEIQGENMSQVLLNQALLFQFSSRDSGLHKPQRPLPSPFVFQFSSRDSASEPFLTINDKDMLSILFTRFKHRRRHRFTWYFSTFNSLHEILAIAWGKLGNLAYNLSILFTRFKIETTYEVYQGDVALSILFTRFLK